MIAHGGQTQKGIYIEPTVVDGVTPASRLFNEEIFGPILSVTTFENLAEAVTLANDTNYGLAASVYTGSLRKAIKLSREIRAGIGDRQLLRRGRCNDTLRRLQGIRLRRTRQVDFCT